MRQINYLFGVRVRDKNKIKCINRNSQSVKQRPKIRL